MKSIAFVFASTKAIGLELKAIGLATHFIASENLSIVLERLQGMGTTVRDHSAVDSALKKLEVDFARSFAV